MTKLNPSEKAVLKSLLENPYSLSTTKIADEGRVSWNTADKYLNQFLKKGWVRRTKRGLKKRKEVWIPLL